MNEPVSNGPSRTGLASRRPRRPASVRRGDYSRDASRNDPWVRRARPSFLYVMYALLLWAIPMGLIAAARPELAEAISQGITGYLRGLPDELYALFGTGYLGYTAARQWGKARGIE